ncbi:MAG: flagellar basal body L-ring protein FlgH [Gemmatimonadaceae bacterium]|nr:flagellar basal body L-ring protein FlgH [Gemmatimonadaceae bacterium]
MTLSHTRLLTIAALGSLVATSLVHAQAATQQPPRPAATTGATAAPAAGATATAAPSMTVRSSWVSDRRDFAVGDIITVLIDDYTISTAVKEDLATDKRNRGLSADAQLPSSNKSVGITTRNTADQTKRGQARRENRFQNEMSVRVVAIAPNGLLQLKGTKAVDVDKAKQNIIFTGFVRPQDITPGNSVESSRVADISIGYASPGPLGTPKQGMLTKILGALWP